MLGVQQHVYLRAYQCSSLQALPDANIPVTWQSGHTGRLGRPMIAASLKRRNVCSLNTQ